MVVEDTDDVLLMFLVRCCTSGIADMSQAAPSTMSSESDSISPARPGSKAAFCGLPAGPDSILSSATTAAAD